MSCTFLHVAAVRVGLVGCLGLCLSLSACQESKAVRTTEIFGKISLDGTPLPTGTILLEPESGPGAPVVGEIREGEFRLKSEIGPKKVSIMSNRDTGKTGQYGEPVIEQIVPVKFNQKSTLTTEVPLSGPAEINFDLKSK